MQETVLLMERTQRVERPKSYSEVESSFAKFHTEVGVQV